MARKSAQSYRFIKAPPKKSMRRQSPASAPKLYEWLTEHGYVEPVSTYRNRTSRATRRARRR